MPKVTLNSVVYEAVPFERNNILGLVHVEHIEPFADAFSTTGQTRQERIQSHDSRNFPSPVEGMGVRKILAHNESDPDSYKFFWDSDGVDTRWPSKYTLPREKQAVAEISVERIWDSADFAGQLKGLWTSTNTTGSLGTVNFDVNGVDWDYATADVIATGLNLTGLALMPYKNKLFVLYASSDDHVVKYKTATGSWTAAASTPIAVNLLTNAVAYNEEIDAGLLVVIGGKLVAVLWHEKNGTITFYSTTDGDTWVDEATEIASGGGVKGVAVMTAADRTEHLIVATQEGLYDVDVSGTYSARLIYKMPSRADNGRRMTVHSDGALWFSQSVGNSLTFQVFRLFLENGDWRVQETRNSPHLFDGVPTDAWGPIRWMKSAGGFMYASVGGGIANRNARVICHNGLGWHTMVKHGTANQKIYWIDVSAESDTVERLHYGVTTGADSTDTFFVQVPSSNPVTTNLFNWEDQGTLDRPTTDMGMPFISKTIIQYQSNAENLSPTNSDRYINLRDALDGEARGANDRGDFLSGDTDLVIASGAGVASKTITIREVLHKTGTDTPSGVSVEVDFKAQPSEIQRYFLRVDIEATAVETGIDASDVQGNLKTVRTSKILVPFSYMNESTVYVDVKVARNDKFDSDSESEALDSQYGTVDLILEEVL